MLETVRQLVRLLSAESLSVEDVVARVGQRVRDPGPPMPLELAPTDAGVRAATLSRGADGAPSVLTLELAPDAGLTPALLGQAFGDVRQVPTDRGRPPTVILYAPASGSRWRVALVADLDPAPNRLEERPVRRLSFRRDLMGE